MNKYLFLFILTFYLILSFLSLAKIPLFYDAPEYLKIVSENSLLKSIRMGHFPNHPVFMADLWISIKLITFFFNIDSNFAGNIYAYIYGLMAILIFWKLSNSYLEKKKAYLATLIFAFFPANFIINTNLLVESLALPLFLLATYLYSLYLNKQLRVTLFSLIFVLLLLFTTHIETIFWVFAMLSVPYLMGKRGNLWKVGGVIFLSIAASLGVYYAVGSGNFTRQLSGSGFYLNQLGGIYNLARYARNLSLSLFRGYGILTIILFAYIIVKNIKSNIFLKGLSFFLLTLTITGGFWTGDFMIRRIVFAGVIFALLIAKYIGKFSIIYLPYLFLIIIFNIFLYLNKPIWVSMNEMHEQIGDDSELLQTHYVRPFEKFSGEIVWIGQDPFDVDKYLSQQKKVFLDSQGFYAPYMQYTGNNMHITSLGKFGDSEAKILFEEYQMDLAQVQNTEKRIYLFEVKEDTDYDFNQRIEVNRKVLAEGKSLIIGKTDPGTPVIFYSSDPTKLIRRERIDYGDLLSRIWVIITKKKEPIGWTYGDATGTFVFVVDTESVDKIYFDKSKVDEFYIIDRYEEKAYIYGQNQ